MREKIINRQINNKRRLKVSIPTPFFIDIKNKNAIIKRNKK